jgi:hypothetical protein
MTEVQRLKCTQKLKFFGHGKLLLFREVSSIHGCPYRDVLCILCRREGYVPSNYVKRVGQTMEGEEWFFPTLSRTRAEDILKEEAKEGGFVVRNSSRENMYTLSICHEGQVRHYHVKHEDGNYYISDKHRFPTVKQLIEYHKLNGGGLVTRLRKPPQQLLPQLKTLSPLFDEAWEIDKGELTLGRELGSGQFGVRTFREVQDCPSPSPNSRTRARQRPVWGEDIQGGPGLP